MVYKLNPGVELFETEEETYILDQTTGEKYTIGGAGVEIFKLIDGERSMDDILMELVKIYGPNVQPYVIAKDLDGFVYAMVDSGLVNVVKIDYPDFPEFMKARNKKSKN